MERGDLQHEPEGKTPVHGEVGAPLPGKTLCTLCGRMRLVLKKNSKRIPKTNHGEAKKEERRNTIR